MTFPIIYKTQLLLIILGQRKKKITFLSRKTKNFLKLISLLKEIYPQIYKVLLDRRKVVHAEKNPLPDLVVDVLAADKRNINIVADFPWKYMPVT